MFHRRMSSLPGCGRRNTVAYLPCHLHQEREDVVYTESPYDQGYAKKGSPYCGVNNLIDEIH